MPVGDEDVRTASSKLCPHCGYLHETPGESSGADLCEYCETALSPPLKPLFRIQNVSTKRRDRINCDEEERQRQGYEIKTGIRFTVHGGRPSYRKAILEHAVQGHLGNLTYGPAAKLWRINLGWRRRKLESQWGFLLDTERGYWAKNEIALEEDEGDPMSAKTKRVIPYVEDHRNCLLFEPAVDLDDGQMASLQSALKSAIQTVYQLEDSELAAEPLPSKNDRRLILFYEAAEGGAGVLKRLITEPGAVSEVSKQALDVCHFDPDTAEDREQGPAQRRLRSGLLRLPLELRQPDGSPAD